VAQLLKFVTLGDEHIVASRAFIKSTPYLNQADADSP
jgi:hypothetical protein